MLVPSKQTYIAIASLVVLTGWGGKEEDITTVAGNGKKPSVNFYGMVVDNTETSVPAQYITVGGKYKQFECYLIPKDLEKKDYNPADNIARLDLAEIYQINVSDPAVTYTFSNRTYLEIEIISNDQKTVNTYMIESGKKLYFDEINDSGPIERELIMSAVKQVTIQGYAAAQSEKKEENKGSDIVGAQISPRASKQRSLEELPVAAGNQNQHHSSLVRDIDGF